MGAVNSQLTDEVEITITPVATATDPPVIVFNVVIENEGGSWNDTWPTEQMLEVYLRGVEVGASMVGGTLIHRPMLPLVWDADEE